MSRHILKKDKLRKWNEWILYLCSGVEGRRGWPAVEVSCQQFPGLGGIQQPWVEFSSIIWATTNIEWLSCWTCWSFQAVVLSIITPPIKAHSPSPMTVACIPDTNPRIGRAFIRLFQLLWCWIAFPENYHNERTPCNSIKVYDGSMNTEFHTETTANVSGGYIFRNNLLTLDWCCL